MMRILSIVFLLLSWCSFGLADGLIRDGLGAISAGRGGTNIGWADNGSVLHDNVGGMVNMQSCSLVECAFDTLFSDVEYSEPGGVSDYRQDLVPLGHFSITKKVHEDIAVGLGVFAPGGFATKSVMPGPFPLTGERNYKSFGALVRVLPGISLRLTDRWSLGATTGVAASHVELEGPYTLNSGVLRNTPTLMDVQGTGAAFTWSIGSQYQVSSRTTIGFNYQSENRFKMDGSVKTFIPGVGESVFDSTIKMVWPRSVGAGIRHQLSPTKVGAIDLVYYNWQRSFEDVTMNLTNASNPFVANFGPLEERMPLKWRDSLSVRVGFEQTLCNQDRARFGYVYHRNPIPSSTLTTYISPILEHTLSIGYGTRYRRLNVDLGYQYMFGDTVNIGTSELAGGDFSNGRMKTQAHFLFLSFGQRG